MSTTTTKQAPLPLVAHLIYVLDYGGLEALLVDSINGMKDYRHAVLCLTRATEFAGRIARPDVEIIELHKRPGSDLGMHLKIWRILRRLRPQVLHTYNLGTIEYHGVAALSGVAVRVHAEHGREASDPHGLNPRHRLLRRLAAPLVHSFVPVSSDLEDWLTGYIGIPSDKVRLIQNGIPVERFAQPQAKPEGWPFGDGDIVIGTVGRAQDVKNQAALLDAFAALRAAHPHLPLRLALIGDGPLLARLREQAARLGLGDSAWLPGARTDIAALMQRLRVFALPSLAEGTPVSVLEAMASSLPVVASAVGGLPALVQHGVTGTLVPQGDATALEAALLAYCRDAGLARQHGAAGQQRVERHYSNAAMQRAYADLYQRKPFRTSYTSNPQCAE
jgi:sugar transferase (PEP-CTERM/EpsH1 system associated)